MASVFLADLDGDWIAPSQACTNPIFNDKGADTDQGDTVNAGRVVLSMEEDNTTITQPNLIHQTVATSGKVKASVSLNDCLACSGCVTSAETVLITEQSNTKFLEALGNPGVKVVVSLSPQSLASLADNFVLPAPKLAELLSRFFNSIGAVLITDMSVSSDIALLETASEFVARFRQKQPPRWMSPEVSLPYSSTRVLYTDRPHQPLIERHSDSIDSYTLLPMLASSCPGFICYAEKTQQAVLPYISTAKSPQQIMGTLAKEVLASRAGIESSSIYHATVMPCFDKKLEATRKDFYHEDSGLKEVDLCLTTMEVVELLVEKAQGMEPLAYLTSLSASPPQPFLSTIEPSHRHDIVSSFTGSGGSAEFTFRYAAKELFGVEIPHDQPLDWKDGRNEDIKEVKLEVRGEVVLHFAMAYGFRNIQSVIQKMRRKSSPYHFVEIMACPGGCVNGGAQIKDSMESKAKKRERVARVQDQYASIDGLRSSQSIMVGSIYEALGGGPFSNPARLHLHTTYHAVPKMELVNPEVIRW